MTWQIESFTDVGGNKDQEFVKYIDLPSRTRAAIRTGHQRTADAAARARLVDGRRHGCLAHAGDYRDFIQGRGRSSASPSTPTWRRDRAGSAIGRNAISPPGRPALVQDTGWTATCPHGEGLLAFSSPTRRSPGIDRINSDYPTHARRRAGDRRANISTPAACCPRCSRWRRWQPLRIAHVAPVATSVPPPRPARSRR